MTIAAQNCRCKMETLKALGEMGLDLKKQCEIQATVLMYYTRYAKVIN